MTSETADDLLRRYGDLYRPLVTGLAVTASFTMVVSGTIVSVAIPNVMGNFGLGQDQAQLLSTAFFVAMTVGQLLNAWLIAVLGQRHAFCGCLAVFATASVLGATAEEFGPIVFARVLQGAAGGLVLTQTMVAIFEAYPATRRGFAMGLFAGGQVLAIGLGPAFGGIVVEVFGWRHIFLAPLPLVALAFLVGLVLMPSTRGGLRPRFDWPGYGLLILAIYCLMTGLSGGQREGWASDYILGLFLVALGSGVAFVSLQLRSGPRLLDFSLFRIGPFLATLMVGFITGVGNYGTAYAIPVFAQIVQSLTPVDAGLLMVPATVLVLFLLPVTGRLADLIAPRWGVLAGLSLFAIGTLPMAGADANTPFLTVALLVVVMRMGMSFNLPFVNNTALASLPPDKLNAGAGMLNFFRQLGASVGTNAWVVFLDMRTHFHSEALTATQSSANAASRELLDGVGRILGESGVPASAHGAGALHYLGQVVHAQANMLGFQDGFLILTAFFVLAMVPAWALGGRRHGRRQGQA